jgi:aminocarboxymuconate-semialdehyde decarboxylase
VNAVDVHAHVIVPEVLQGPGALEAWRPRRRVAGGRSVISFGGRTIASIIEEFVEVDAILAAQERRGVDHTVLSPWVALISGSSGAEAARRCEIQNEGLARLRARSPERVSVLGAVPLDDVPAAVLVLDALMRSGSFVGVEIPASVGGRYLGDVSFEPFWEAVASLRAFVFVHPTTRGFDAPVFAEHYLWNLLGNPFETTIAAAHMVMAGVMERHPNLRVLLAHGGGAIVALRGRLGHGHRDVAATRGALEESPEQSIGRFLFDSVTHDPGLLRSLVDTVGADQVLLGSDYPFDMGDRDPVATVREAGFGPADERAILSGNAERLLDLAAAAAR